MIFLADVEKFKEKIVKEAKEQGVDPKYLFFAYEEKGDTRFVSSIIGKGELHNVVGMLERAKHDFLKLIDKQ